MRGDAVRRTQQHGQDNPVGSKSIQQPKRDRRDYEQIHRRNALGVIAQKGLPTLRRWLVSPRHVFCHCGLPDIDAKLEHFAKQAFENRVYESRGIREASWISLSRCHPNQLHASLACTRFRRHRVRPYPPTPEELIPFETKKLMSFWPFESMFSAIAGMPVRDDESLWSFR